MKEYLDIVNRVIEQGRWKGNRTGVRAKTIANQFFSFDMSSGKFPLVTTKRVSMRNVAVELEAFIKGVTDKRWFADRGCHIWDDWASPQRVDARMIRWQNENCHLYSRFKDCVIDSEKLRKKFQREEQDLGPLGYSWGWRKFGETYDDSNVRLAGVSQGFDQLADIVKKLKNNPDDRRMVCSAWNPNQISQMALPPCHFAWVVTHIDGELNLHWTQRSCDLGLGVPYNIASYALLLLLLCKEANLRPGNLAGTLCDCHIYEDHIQGMQLQLTREPYELPSLVVSGKLKSDKPFSIFDWTYEDLTLMGYQYHPAIKLDIAV